MYTTPRWVAAREALVLHGVYRLGWDTPERKQKFPAKADYLQCKGCGHISRTEDERLDHRLEEILGAWEDDA